MLNVSLARSHKFSKRPALGIRLLAGEGVEGDAHCGKTVKHRSRARFNPTLPNLRQVHLMHSELFEELAARGHPVTPGDLGENILTAGIPLLDLPAGTELHLGATAVVRLTGLRNPCVQMDRFQAGLVEAVVERAADGSLVRKAGVMGVVLAGGEVQPGDPISIVYPPAPHVPLAPV